MVQGRNYLRLCSKNIVGSLVYNSNSQLDTVFSINMHKANIKWSNPKHVKRCIERLQIVFF